MLAGVGDRATCLLNALTAEQHAGTGGADYGRPGRIKGSVNVVARELVKYLFVGRTLQYDQDVDEKLRALDVAAVGTALKKHVDPQKLVTIKAGDFKKVAPPK